MKGRICLDGVDIQQLNIQWLRSSLGLVSQEPILFNLTIAQNIAYGKENTSIEDIIDVATKANIHHFIQQLPQGYDTRVGMKGGHLSGGEKQRIAIARVLLRRPKILLLDEATSVMDSHNEQIVQEALEKAETENSTCTSLIIAHRLSTIRSCDMIYVLEKGYLVDSGTHADLMERRGAYYRMIVRSNLPNHLSDIQRTFIRLRFHDIDDLMKACKELQPIVKRNIEREKEQQSRPELAVLKRATSSNPSSDLIVDGLSNANVAEKQSDHIIELREFDVPYHIRVRIVFVVNQLGEPQNQLVLKPDLIEQPEPIIFAFDIECTKMRLKFPSAASDQ
ncbi:unnamed protein product, partial [Rotaria sp. Silwood2]